MLETIKEQFKQGKTLTQSKYYHYIDRNQWPKFYWDMLPLGQDYYHELNPYFLFNLYRLEHFRFSKCITVRDGYLTFASFILENFKSFSKLESGPLLIHPDLAPLVPPTLTQHFASWQLVQKKQLQIQEAKKVLIIGFANFEHLGDRDRLALHLKALDQIHKDATIEVYLPIRKDVFGKNNREPLYVHNALSLLKDVLPGRDIKFITGEQLFEMTDFKYTYVFDLASDKMLISDNYLHYYVQSRGGSVNNGTLLERPSESLFHFDLSIHHEFHVVPLPRVKSVFVELLFFKKLNPGKKDFNFDITFQRSLREVMSESIIKK
jgi:hypothetical protein